MAEELIRTAIADDDEGMRLVMRRIIEKAEGYELVGEFADGQSLVDQFGELKPDLCVLDVEMPGLSGIECARIIQDTNPMTVIIIATAHEEYMGEAFSVYAFDYLLKPFKLARVNQTLDRVRERIRSDKESVALHLPRIAKPRPAPRIMLRNKEGVSIINAEDVALVQREQRSTVLYTADGRRYVTSDTLAQIEERLDPAQFFRCHKSYIVNLDLIDSITPYGRWTYVIRLRGLAQDALITHDKFEELEARFD